MSAHYIYRLRDPKTGALLHEGTPTELVAKGLFPDRDRLQSEYMRQKKTVKKPRIWRIEREKRPPAATKTLLREVWEYTAWDAAGNRMAKGTAAELVEQGFFDCTQMAANWARKGCCPARGIAELTREKGAAEHRAAERGGGEKAPEGRAAPGTGVEAAEKGGEGRDPEAQGPGRAAAGRARAVRVQRSGAEAGPAGAELRRVGRTGKAGNTIKTALRQSSLGALATKDKACRVVCSGRLHLSRNGLSGPGRGRTYLIIMRDCSRASGGTLLGGLYTRYFCDGDDHGNGKTQDADDQQEVPGCEEATSGKRNTSAVTST